jgi:uncharacterized protein (DUF3820 family)
MKLKERKQKQAEALEVKKRTLAEKVDLLRKSWNPLPVRGQKQKRLTYTIEKRSNFINCKQRVFNVGKYKGIDIKDVPTSYINWVRNNIELNDSELQLLKKIK